MHQGGHLVDEGARPAGAGAVHPLLQRAAEKDDFGVLAAQFDDRVVVGYVLVDGGGGGVHLERQIAQGGGILYPTYPKSLLSYPYAVPEDSVFILGDCRTQAEDSRDFGPVQCSAVKAKVITLIRRRGL